MNSSVPKCNQAGKEFTISVDQNNREKAVFLSDEFPLSLYTQQFCHAALDAVPFHWHKELQITWVVKGKLSYSVNDETFLLDSAKALLIGDHQLHSCKTVGTDAKTLCLNFSTDIFQTIIQKECILPFLQKNPFSYILLPLDSSNIRTLEALLSVKNEPKGYVSIMHFVYGIFDRILQTYEEPTSPGNNKELELFQTVLDYVHAHYSEPLTIKEISEQVFINRNRLTQLFNKYTHMSPIKYLNQYRLYEAKNLIVSTDMPISDISPKVGYNELSHFIQQFREAYGLSPLKYRNRYGKNHS